MEPKEFDFEFPRGDTCPLEFTLTDNEGNELDLNNAEIYFTVKKSYSVTDFIFQKRYSRKEITVEGTTANLVITHKDTATLSYGSYVYDIQVKSGDYVKTVALGTITITNESTFLANE